MLLHQSEFDEAIRRCVADWRIELTARHSELMFRHFSEMTQWNKVMNLTRIIDPVDAAVKHYADSLSLSALAFEQNWPPASLLDIGTGAGFPALPIAVIQPAWEITAIDGTGKKIDFLRSTVTQLGLKNLTALHAHSNHWKTSEQFDIITGRAVANSKGLYRDGARFLTRSGRIVVFATQGYAAAEDSTLEPPQNPSLRHELDWPYTLQFRGETLARVLQVFRSTSALDPQ